jgi:hypothetical protein
MKNEKICDIKLVSFSSWLFQNAKYPPQKKKKEMKNKVGDLKRVELL